MGQSLSHGTKIIIITKHTLRLVSRKNGQNFLNFEMIFGENSNLIEQLKRFFKRFSITLSPNSSAYKMKTLIGRIKDKPHTFKKSGVYAVLCTGCDNVYIGRSGREVDGRFCEHYKPYHERTFRKSTAADHMLENGHEIAGFRLLRAINRPNYLDAFEKVYIYRTKNNNMNIQNSQVENTLLKFTKPLKTKDIFKMKI